MGTGSAYVESAQQAYGLPVRRPLPLMRDHLLVLRRLLAGEQVDYEGDADPARVQLGFRPPRVPVYLGALGPRMLRLAGEASDGAGLNWCTPSRSPGAGGAWKRAAPAPVDHRARCG